MRDSPGSVVTLLCSGIQLYSAERRIADCIRAAEIHNEIFGSDHCPVELQIDL